MNGTIVVHGIYISLFQENLDAIRAKLLDAVGALEPLKSGVSHIACNPSEVFGEITNGGIVIAEVYIDPHDETDAALEALMKRMHEVFSTVLRLSPRALSYRSDSPDEEVIYFPSGTGLMA